MHEVGMIERLRNSLLERQNAVVIDSMSVHLALKLSLSETLSFNSIIILILPY